MTSDNGSNENLKKDIDLDEIEVEILIVAKNPAKMKATAAFLSRRGWPTIVLGSISQAIEHVADQKPDIVLISVNHQNPSASKLPDLLSATFGTTSVGFCEQFDNVSNAKLTKSKITHKIWGQGSGPNLHRGIRAILAEKFGIKTDENVVKSGDGTSAQGGVIIQKSSGSLVRDPASVVKGEKAGEENSEQEVVSSGKYTMKKSSRKTFKDLTGKTAFDTPVGGPRLSAAELANQLKATLMADGSTELIEEQETTLLQKMVTDALEQICTPDHVHTKVSTVMRVGVFPVDSQTMPGYLVIASALPERTRLELLQDAEIALSQAFGKAAYPGRIEPGFSVNIPATEFMAWSERSGKFTLVVNHEGVEIAAGFFRTPGPLPRIGNEADGMLSLPVDQVSTGHPVSFKAYLNMPKNKKYFLYLRNGRHLQPEQKKRLEAKDIKDFFMKGVDKENVRAFLAAVFLANSIKDDEAA